MRASIIAAAVSVLAACGGSPSETARTKITKLPASTSSGAIPGSDPVADAAPDADPPAQDAAAPTLAQDAQAEAEVVAMDGGGQGDTAQPGTSPDDAEAEASGPATYRYDFEMPGIDVRVGDPVPARFVVDGTCGGTVNVDYYSSYALTQPTASGVGTADHVRVCLTGACSTYFDISCTGGSLVVTGTSVPNTGGYTPTDGGVGGFACTSCPDQ